MLYSGCRRLRWQLSSCVVALFLVGCGNGGGHSATSSDPAASPGQLQNSVPSQTTAKVSAAATEGGYVTNQNSAMFCDASNEFCSYRAAYGSIESITAISRYGYGFQRWQSDAVAQSTSSASMQLIADQDVSVRASFAKTADVAQNRCADPASSTPFRALHLGDSLTTVQCWLANCPTYLTIPANEPERESIRFYETAMAGNTKAPRVIASGGNRSIGTNFFHSSVADEPLDFENDNYWRATLARHQESLEDFNAVIVALGSNDILDIAYGTTDMDFIFEYRIKPLMQWLANKPVIWVLPHYFLSDFKRGNVNLYARADGISCSCGNTAPDTTQCDLPQALEQCGASADEAHNTINIFKSIHLFRQRMLELRNEYPNLQVVDAEQLLAEQSGGRYDLYQQFEGDKIHFNKQGTEWYSWAQAFLAQSQNAACGRSSPRWDMSAAEIAMASQLNALP